MKIQNRIICECCYKPINPRDGVIIQGNVYMINDDINDRGGLIGNAFPINEKDLTASIKLIDLPSVIKEYAYHHECLLTFLNDKKND